jgi:hypothetical protein
MHNAGLKSNLFLYHYLKGGERESGEREREMRCIIDTIPDYPKQRATLVQQDASLA